MSHPVRIPAAHAAALVRTLDAIRAETAGLVDDSQLSVSADDLLDGAAEVAAWLADLDAAVCRSTSAAVAVPRRDPGTLQHIVFTVSAIMVWAEELACERITMTGVSAEAMVAWRLVERAAGLEGRTSGALRGSSARTASRMAARAASRAARPLLHAGTGSVDMAVRA
ncbi:hypothetical protein BH23ACT9_BH23ACT9_11520 [soil metagenome]